MSAVKFLLADAASAIITLALMVGMGYLGGNSVQVLKRDVTRVEHMAVVVLVLLLVAWIFFRYFKNIRKGNGLP